LLVRAGMGWTPGVVGEVTLKATDDSSEGHALKTGEPTISPNIATETRFTYPPFLIANGVKAAANVVIIGAEGRLPFGILEVDSRTPRPFTDADIAFLRSYANLLAAAVDRLRVIGEARDGEARLRLAVDAADMGTWDLDLVHGGARCSPRHHRIFGYPDPTPEWNLATFLDHVLAEDHARSWKVITLPLLSTCGRRWRAGSWGGNDGRRPRECRSAPPCARRERAAPSPCSSASAASSSCARQ